MVLTVLVSWAERTVAQWHGSLNEFSRQILALAVNWGKPLDKRCVSGRLPPGVETRCSY